MYLRQILRRFPTMFLAARRFHHRLRGRPEAEIGLLGLLSDPNRTSIDIGAHTGLYAEALLSLSKSVVAIEANPHLASELRHLFAHRLQVICAAMSSKAGKAQLRVPKDAIGLSTIDPHNPLRVHPSELMSVDCKTLDDLGVGAVGFVKIDVEGHELEVLRGGLNTLVRDAPALLIEAEERHRGNAVQSIRELLEPLGYHGLMLRNGRLCPIDDFDPAVDQAVHQCDLELLNRGKYRGAYINNFIFVAPRPVCKPAES